MPGYTATGASIYIYCKKITCDRSYIHKAMHTLLIQDIMMENSYFSKICKAINPEIFHRINSAKKNGTSPKNIEIFIRNYENDAIDDDTFLKILKIFNLDPSYFGYNFEISDEDYNDLEDVLEKTDS
jgi:hypothetical protein